MHNKLHIFAPLVALLPLGGCYDAATPTTIVCVVDATASVEPESLAEAIRSLGVAGDRMRRGDRLVIVPVTGDAETETAGRVLRYEAGERREAYDADLADLRERVRADLERLAAETAAHPFASSDLVGAVGIAAEEVALAPRGSRIEIVLLGDLIQDDRRADFKRDRMLDDEQAAIAASRKMAPAGAFSGARVFLGMVRSDDLERIPHGRRDAIRAFWREYFAAAGAAEVVDATDGPGQLAAFLRGGAERHS